MSADVSVTSELTLDASPFQQELNANLAAVEQWAKKVGELHGDVPIRAKDELTAAVENLRRNLESKPINLSVNLVGGGFGGAGGGGGALGFPGVNWTPGAGTAGINIEQQATQMFTQVNTEINVTLEQIIQNTATQARDAIASAAKKSGQSSTDALRAPAGFARYLTFGFAARELFRVAEGVREYGMENDLAGNDTRKQYEATEKFIHRQSFANLLVDPLGDRETGRKRIIESADTTDAAQRSYYNLQNETASAVRQARIAGERGFSRETDEATADYQSRLRGIEDQRRAAGTEGVLDQERKASDARKAAIQEKFNTEREHMIRPFNFSNDRWQGDEADLELRRSKAFGAEDQYHAQRVRDIEGKYEDQRQAAANVRDARIRDATLADQYSAFKNQQQINDIWGPTPGVTGGELGEAQMRARGQTHAAANAEFNRKLENEVADTKAQAAAAIADPDRTRRLQELARVQQLTMPDRVKARQDEIERQEGFERADLREKANDAVLRADEKFYEADLAAIRHHHERRIKEFEDDGRKEEATQERRIEQAELAARENSSFRRAAHINTQTAALRYRRSGHGGVADVLTMQDRFRSEEEQAAGDPRILHAIHARQIEELQGYLQHHHSAADRRDQYTNLLEDARGGHGSGDAAARNLLAVLKSIEAKLTGRELTVIKD